MLQGAVLRRMEVAAQASGLRLEQSCPACTGTGSLQDDFSLHPVQLDLLVPNDAVLRVGRTVSEYLHHTKLLLHLPGTRTAQEAQLPA
jgi:hypothetical protein